MSYAITIIVNVYVIGVEIKMFKTKPYYILDNQILRGIVAKLRIQKKMMEISFEQINNSRNHMIHQLAECEIALENNNE